MDRDDFATWMDKQMAFYREKGIPFIGYFWYADGLTGGLLCRLDKPKFEKPVTKTTIREILKHANKLSREGKHVSIYQG